MTATGSGPRLTLGRTAIGVSLILTFVIAVRPAIDNDMWWHLRSGQWMVAHHRILGADPFSHTAHGAARLPFDWLAQLGLYGIWRVVGFTGLAIAIALLATLSVWLVAAAADGPDLLRAGAILLCAAASSVFWSARPQIATTVLTALVIWLVARARRGHDHLIWLIPIFLVWSNLHLGWIYGLAICWGTVVGALIDQRLHRPAMDPGTVRKLAGVSAVSSLVVMINPVGPRIYPLFLTQAHVGRTYIEEYQPPHLSDPKAVPFFLMLAIVAVVMAHEWRRIEITEAALVIGSAAFAAASIRAVPVFAAVATPVLIHHGAGWLASARAQAPATVDTDLVMVDIGGVARTPSSGGTATGTGPINAILLVAMLVVAALVVTNKLSAANVDAATRNEFPVDATAALVRLHPPPELWNTFDWGGYLIWKAPGYRVSIDGRADLHVDRLATYARVLAGQGWSADFDHAHINTAMVPTGGPLDRAIAASPAWHRIYRDPTATIWVRNHPLPT